MAALKTFRKKGLTFEIEVAKLLSKWINPDAKVPVLWRSHGSGVLEKQLSVQCQIDAKKIITPATMSGDLCCVDPSSQKFCDLFFVECKRWKNLNLTGLIDGKSETLSDYFEELQYLVENAMKYQKIPLLFIKRDFGKDILTTMPSVLTEKLRVVSSFNSGKKKLNLVYGTLRFMFRWEIGEDEYLFDLAIVPMFALLKSNYSEFLEWSEKVREQKIWYQKISGGEIADNVEAERFAQIS